MYRVITILDGKGDVVLKLNDGDWVELRSAGGSTYNECHYISATQFRLGDVPVNYRLFAKQLSRGDFVISKFQVVDNIDIPGAKLRTKTSIKTAISELKGLRRHVAPKSYYDVLYDIELEVLAHALYSSLYKLKLEYMESVRVLSECNEYTSKPDLNLLKGRVGAYEWVLSIKDTLPDL